MYTLGELADELNRQEWAVERMLKNRGYLKNNGDPRKSTIDNGLMNKNGLIKEAGWSVFIDELGYKDTDEDEEDEIEDVDIDDDEEDEDIDEDDEEENEDDEDDEDVDDYDSDEESDIDADGDDNDYDEDEDIDEYDEDMAEWYDLIYSFDVEILNDIMEMDGIYMFAIVYKKDDNIYTAYVNVENKELEDVECHGPYSKELERKVNDKLLDEWQSRFDAENPESKGEPAWVKLANARAKRNRNNR